MVGGILSGGYCPDTGPTKGTLGTKGVQFFGYERGFSSDSKLFSPYFDLIVLSE